MRRRRLGTGGLLATLIAVGAAIGCYNPVINEGDFLCGTGGACPTGWTCNSVDNRCHRTLTSITDAAIDRPPTQPADTAPMMCNRGVTCSPGATAGATCDPVCQTGCACDKKCSFMGTQLQCAPIPAAPKQLYEECNPGGDNCAAGLLCTAELETACGSRCYRACRVDADCGANARCTDALGDATGTRVLTKICSPRIEGCNPVGLQTMCGNMGPGNRPFPTFACYLLDPAVDESTVCRCSGTIELGMACAARGDCKPGLECLAGLATDTALRCRRLCSLMGVGVACAVGNVCRPIGPSTRVGACL